mmetsp:Transcript_100012/g.282358  ORF Transcript_100012/g.282358 Transcript_100012/m.282358 type:complete len:220 (-) Transcript_100012:508-1167(-)
MAQLCPVIVALPLQRGRLCARLGCDFHRLRVLLLISLELVGGGLVLLLEVIARGLEVVQLLLQVLFLEVPHADLLVFLLELLREGEVLPLQLGDVPAAFSGRLRHVAHCGSHFAIHAHGLVVLLLVRVGARPPLLQLVHVDVRRHHFVKDLFRVRELGAGRTELTGYTLTLAEPFLFALRGLALRAVQLLALVVDASLEIGALLLERSKLLVEVHATVL